MKILQTFVKKSWVFVLILMIISHYIIIREGNARGPAKKIVVLDPGHGGQDTGVQTGDGASEKMVALTLVCMIQPGTGDSWRPALTRDGDQWLDFFERTSFANHLKADLFISIHTGGSFGSEAGGITVFYFESRPESPKSLSSKSPRSNLWDRIQAHHREKSKILAEFIQRQLSERIQFMETRLRGAQIVAAEGADMPAVLIEAGSLTHPVQGKKLQDQEVLSDIAKAISMGINDFFSNMDLHK
jgi:N-acetylmuramoyl-L-alanine amidase